MIKVLALDQSSHTTGYAIFNDGKFVQCGKFSINDKDIGVRLVKIREKVKELIENNDIDEVIFEDIQLQEKGKNGTFKDTSGTENVQTFKILAEVHGVICELLTDLNMARQCVLPVVWRSTLGIQGKERPTQKQNTKNWVYSIYGIAPTEDECDAIAIGSYYLITKINPSFKAKSVKSTMTNDIEGFDWS